MARGGSSGPVLPLRRRVAAVAGGVERTGRRGQVGGPGLCDHFPVGTEADGAIPGNDPARLARHVGRTTSRSAPAGGCGILACAADSRRRGPRARARAARRLGNPAAGGVAPGGVLVPSARVARLRPAAAGERARMRRRGSRAGSRAHRGTRRSWSRSPEPSTPRSRRRVSRSPAPIHRHFRGGSAPC